MRVSVSESDSDSEGECEWIRDVRSGFGGWYALFCPSCFLCGISTRMNENCCAMSVAPVAMRTKLRIENNIQGSVCDDYCKMGCCRMLIYCQMDRELKHLGR
ncbi:hypothetical protein LSAT2_000555 [Lamellibrachia satsuma]|nr:hypothetical protein LSAT2_000555 [Lamellibrachia satsuma]